MRYLGENCVGSDCVWREGRESLRSGSERSGREERDGGLSGCLVGTGEIRARLDLDLDWIQGRFTLFSKFEVYRCRCAVDGGWEEYRSTSNRTDSRQLESRQEMHEREDGRSRPGQVPWMSWRCLQ